MRSRSDLLILFVLLLGAVAVRVPRLEGPGLLPEREFRAGFITRDIYFAGRADVPAWRKEVVASALAREQVLEPPVMEHLTAFTWRLSGTEDLWLSHVWATLFWLSGGVLLFALVRAVTTVSGAVWPALAYFLYAPAGVRISNAFQPDALMVALMVASLLALVYHHRDPRLPSLVLTAACVGAAALVKPTAAFPLAGACLASIIERRGVRGAVGSRETWVFALFAIPALLYYSWGLFVSRELGVQAEMAFQPHLWGLAVYWREWARLAVWETTPLFFTAALVAPLLAPRGLRGLLAGLWVGYGIYGLVFPYHIHTHPYYQLPLLVIAALSTGIILDRWAPTLLHRVPARLLWPTLVVAVLIVLGAQQRLRREGAPPRYESLADAQRIGEITHHSTRVVFVSRHYGLPLQYRGELGGTFWPRAVLYRYATQQVIGRYTVSERLNALGFSPEFFVVTDFRSWERYDADLAAAVTAGCEMVASTETFEIWSKCRLAGGTE
jgi:hypothetical protein